MTDPEVFKGGKKEKIDKDDLDHGKKAHVEEQKEQTMKAEKKQTREDLAGFELTMKYEQRRNSASKLSADCMKKLGNVDDAEKILEKILILPKDHAEKHPELLNSIKTHAPVFNDAVREKDEAKLREEMGKMAHEIEDFTKEPATESADTAEISSEP